MHHVIFDGFHAHRLEGAGADVQRHERHFHALGAQRRQQRFVEVQAGGRCGDRARLLAVDRLIQLAVGVLIRASDIRRQRHMAGRVENGEDIAFVVEAQLEQRLVARHHGGGDALVIPQQQLGARLRRFRRAHVRQHAMVVQHALHQHFNLAAADLAAEHARRDHAGIVEHQQVAGFQLIQQIGEYAVRQRPARPVQLQQAACAALGLGIVGNQGFGKFKRKISDAHGYSLLQFRAGW